MPDAKPIAGRHWRHFRRLMAFMFAVAVVTIAVALAVLDGEGVVLRAPFVIALGLGIGVSVLLTGALMGLIFISANSGHDEEVERFKRVGDKPVGPWGPP